jgi:hypothetical protein
MVEVWDKTTQTASDAAGAVASGAKAAVSATGDAVERAASVTPTSRARREAPARMSVAPRSTQP